MVLFNNQDLFYACNTFEQVVYMAHNKCLYIITIYSISRSSWLRSVFTPKYFPALIARIDFVIFVQ